jgi:hypothetical protein
LMVIVNTILGSKDIEKAVRHFVCGTFLYMNFHML